VDGVRHGRQRLCRAPGPRPHGAARRDPRARGRIGHGQNSAAAPDAGPGPAHARQRHGAGPPRRRNGARGRGEPRGHAVPARRAVFGLRRARQRGLCAAGARHAARRAGARRGPGQAADGGPAARARHAHAGRPLGRHGQARSAGACAHHGPAAVAARRAHRRARSEQFGRILHAAARAAPVARAHGGHGHARPRHAVRAEHARGRAGRQKGHRHGCAARRWCTLHIRSCANFSAANAGAAPCSRSAPEAPAAPTSPQEA